MPELAEIHSYARNINGWTHNVVFDEVVKHATGKGPDLSLILIWPFSIFAQARGKELQLTFTRQGSEQNSEATFRHGLVGIWEWAPIKRLPKHTHIHFGSSSAGHALCFVDSNRLGTWNEGSFDRVTRGPDPINEFDAFRTNVLGRIRNISKPICEVLLDQQLFNGIGNYLRAEILYRACISPFVNASELFSVNSKASSRLLSLCRTVPLEVFDLRLNKYGDRDEKAAFQSWLKVYGKSPFQVIKGRKIYYDSEQHTREPEEDIPVPLRVGQADNNRTKPVSASPLARAPGTNIVTPKREFVYEPREKNVKKVLLAASLLFSHGKITKEQKDWMKNAAFQGDDLVFCAMETYEADRLKDEDDFAENISLMSQLASDPRNRSIYF